MKIVEQSIRSISVQPLTAIKLEHGLIITCIYIEKKKNCWKQKFWSYFFSNERGFVLQLVQLRRSILVRLGLLLLDEVGPELGAAASHLDRALVQPKQLQRRHAPQLRQTDSWPLSRQTENL